MPAQLMCILQWSTYLGMLDFPFIASVDGDFFPRDPIAMIDDGEVTKTNLITGSNKDEGKGIPIKG